MDRFIVARTTILASLFLLAGALLQSCGGGGGGGAAAGGGGATTAPPSRFVYVANHGDILNATFGSDLSAFTITASGALASNACGSGSACSGTNFAVGSHPYSVTVHPSGKFLYVDLGSSPGHVGVYAINSSNGSLTQVPCVAGSGVVCYGNDFAIATTISLEIVFDRSGKFAYVTHYGTSTGGDISAYAVGSTGALTQIPCVSGTGATCSGNNYVAGIYPDHAVVDPSGKFLYVTNKGGGAGDLTAFAISSTGALIQIACVSGSGAVCNGSNFAVGSSPASVIFDSSGKFVYVANEGGVTGGGVSAYSIAATGALIPIACVSGNGVVCNGVYFAAGAGSSSIALTPSGRFIYVANGISANGTSYDISAFATTASGTLIPIPCVIGNGAVCSGSNYAVGVSPMSIVIDNSGKYAYVVNQGEYVNSTSNVTKGDISVFAITTNGALTPIACVSGSGVVCNGSNFAAGANSYSIATAP